MEFQAQKHTTEVEVASVRLSARPAGAATGGDTAPATAASFQFSKAVQQSSSAMAPGHRFLVSRSRVPTADQPRRAPAVELRAPAVPLAPAPPVSRSRER